MKVVCLSLCFIGILLVGEVYPSWFDPEFVEDPSRDYDSTDTYDEEEPVEDYPQLFYVPLNSETEGNNVPTEENEIEPEVEPNVETSSGEGGQPGNTDLGPLPDPNTLILEGLIVKVDKLLSDFKSQQDKIAELEEANKKLILKIDWLEQQTKTNNIILTNVHQDLNETFKITLQRVLHVFNRIMRVRISAGDIAVALRAETNSSTANKPIVVRFTNFATKMKVLAFGNRLSRANIGITSDYSELVAQRRAALLPYLKQARARGVRAYILYDKLVVDGVRMTLEELVAQEDPYTGSDQNEPVEMLDTYNIK